jgi:hypothetical protein
MGEIAVVVDGARMSRILGQAVESPLSLGCRAIAIALPWGGGEIPALCYCSLGKRCDIAFK